jgi:hypothetical protein
MKGNAMQRLYKIYFIVCIIAGIMGIIALIHFVGEAFSGGVANQPAGIWGSIVLSMALCTIAFITANVYGEKLKK